MVQARLAGTAFNHSMSKPIGHDALLRVLSRAIGGATGLSPSYKLIRIGAAGESIGLQPHAREHPLGTPTAKPSIWVESFPDAETGRSCSHPA